jgi:Ulp1 family protease
MHCPAWAVIDSLNYTNLDKKSDSNPWPGIADEVRQVQYLLVPINVNNSHWQLVVADRHACVVRLYDSLPGGGDAGQATLRHVRMALLTDKLGWNAEKWALDVAACPQQRDGHSCGPHILWWAREVVDDIAGQVTRPSDGWHGMIRKTLDKLPRQGRDDQPSSFARQSSVQVIDMAGQEELPEQTDNA